MGTSAFDLFGVFAEKLFKYSTPISHGWWLVNFVFRMFVVGSVGSAIYDDEQGNFHCDTIQPGCKQLCFNRFSPMQHPRFWGFQMLFCTLPSVIFILSATLTLVEVIWVTTRITVKGNKRRKLKKKEKRNYSKRVSSQSLL